MVSVGGAQTLNIKRKHQFILESEWNLTKFLFKDEQLRTWHLLSEGGSRVKIAKNFEVYKIWGAFDGSQKNVATVCKFGCTSFFLIL